MPNRTKEKLKKNKNGVPSFSDHAQWSRSDSLRIAVYPLHQDQINAKHIGFVWSEQCGSQLLENVQSFGKNLSYAHYFATNTYPIKNRNLAPDPQIVLAIVKSPNKIYRQRNRISKRAPFKLRFRIPHPTKIKLANPNEIGPRKENQVAIWPKERTINRIWGHRTGFSSPEIVFIGNWQHCKSNRSKANRICFAHTSGSDPAILECNRVRSKKLATLLFSAFSSAAALAIARGVLYPFGFLSSRTRPLSPLASPIRRFFHYSHSPQPS